MIDDPETVCLPPDPGGEPGSSPDLDAAAADAFAEGTGTGDSLGAAGRMVLLEEEVARARGWAWIAMLLGLAALLYSPLVELVPLARGCLLAALVAFVGMSGVVLVRTHQPGGYTSALYRAWGYGSALLCIPLMYALGIFSATPLIVTLGLTFFALGLDRRHAIAIPITAIAGYVIVALAVSLDVIENVGMYAAPQSERAAKLFFTLFVPLVFAGTLWFARVSRRSMMSAIERATDAQRVASQREAQLMEARQDLEEALKAAAGFGGRYTGRRVGDFELGSIVGRGAMGEVYGANHVVTGEPAAVKLLRGHVAGVEVLKQRFVREGRIAAELDAPNVVKVLDIGVVEGFGPYIAMELLSGDDLAAQLRHAPQLPFDEVRRLIRQVAQGLDAAHEAGIVHRDLKPGNLFFHQRGELEGQWKILDFGVSKLTDSGGTLTQGEVLGTPAYMAPEQAQGHDADRRADVYALGAVAFRALTGQAPFTGPDTPAVLFDVVFRMPPRPSSLRRELPPQVDFVLALAMAKDRTRRFATAGDLAGAVERGLEGELTPEEISDAEALLHRYPWGRLTARGESSQKIHL